MCSIIGSFKKDKIIELVKLNQHRGNFSYSISIFDINDSPYMVGNIRNFGKFDIKELDNCYVHSDSLGEYYYICHVQDPTNGLIKDRNRIHPNYFTNKSVDSELWHNGIITAKGMDFIKENIDNKDIDLNFDTALLNTIICEKDYNILSEIDGLFTCVRYYHNQFFKQKIDVFRTRHGKLYVDDELNMSSEKFEGSKCINADTIYTMDFKNKKLIESGKFKTLNFNFNIKGEM